MARASLGTCRESTWRMVLKQLRARSRRYFSEPGTLSSVSHCFHLGRSVPALTAMRDHPQASVSASWSFWGKSVDKALLLPRGGGTAHHWPGSRTARWPEQEGAVWEVLRRSRREWLGEGLASLILFSVQDILKVRV